MSRNRIISLLVIAAMFGVGNALLLERFEKRLEERISAEAPRALDGGPRRMAVFSVAVVEILFALDAGDRIAGTSRFAVYPPEAAKIPKLGGVMDINFERLAMLRPDMILAQSSGRRLAAFAESRRIPFRQLKIDRIGDVFDTIRDMARLLGREGAGTRLVAKLQEELDAVRKKTADLARVPCFISVDRRAGQLTQLLSAGGETFLNELLTIAGGRNIFAQMSDRYPTVSKEALIARAPHVILEMKPGERRPENHRALRQDWALLSGIPAVANRRVAFISHEAALLPSLRMGEVATQIALALHPEAFSEQGDTCAE